MLRSTLLLLAAPLTGVLAQTSPIQVTIVSPNQTEIRFRPGVDSARRMTFRSTELLSGAAGTPFVVRGRAEFVLARADGLRTDTVQTIEFIALDSTTKIHVEVSQNDRVIASGDGPYLTVRRDVDGMVIEARSHVPTSGAQVPRKP
jgi:hypothetical protein